MKQSKHSLLTMKDIDSMKLVAIKNVQMHVKERQKYDLRLEQLLKSEASPSCYLRTLI